MDYKTYYKLKHRRCKYQIKYMLDFLSTILPYGDIGYSEVAKSFSLPLSTVLKLDKSILNLLSKTVSSHGYYDAISVDTLYIIPLLRK